MELTYKDLTKKDVINIADGKCLGRITNIKFVFPAGKIVGIFVPGRKCFSLFRIFDKTEIYIDEGSIVKIGGDVILVNLRCKEDCSPKPVRKKENQVMPPPPCAPFCPPKPPQPKEFDGGISASEFSQAFDDNDY